MPPDGNALPSAGVKLVVILRVSQNPSIVPRSSHACTPKVYWNMSHGNSYTPSEFGNLMFAFILQSPELNKAVVQALVPTIGTVSTSRMSMPMVCELPDDW